MNLLIFLHLTYKPCKNFKFFLIFTYNQGKVVLILPIFTYNQGKVFLTLPITPGAHIYLVSIGSCPPPSIRGNQATDSHQPIWLPLLNLR